MDIYIAIIASEFTEKQNQNESKINDYVDINNNMLDKEMPKFE